MSKGAGVERKVAIRGGRDLQRFIATACGGGVGVEAFIALVVNNIVRSTAVAVFAFTAYIVIIQNPSILFPITLFPHTSPHPIHIKLNNKIDTIATPTLVRLSEASVTEALLYNVLWQIGTKVGKGINE